MKSKPISPDRREPRKRLFQPVWILLGFSGLFLAFALLLALIKEPLSSWLPVHLHSVLVADYSPDPRGRPVAQVRFSVIREIITDLVNSGLLSATIHPDERYANVISYLQTPVPTVTAMPGATIFVPTAQPAASQTPTPQTETLATAAPTLTATPTPTGVASATATLLVSPSSTATIVFVYPTATRKPPTQPPAATNTSAPAPTQPPTMAPTPTPRPTQPPPPTPQPTRPSYPPPYP